MLYALASSANVAPPNVVTLIASPTPAETRARIASPVSTMFWLIFPAGSVILEFLTTTSVISVFVATAATKPTKLYLS